MRSVCKQPGLSPPRQQRRLQRLGEAPGSQQGFSSCPAVTQITSNTGSLIPRPPYRGSRFSPGRLGPFPRQLRTVQHYLSVVHGEGRGGQTWELRWLGQRLTPRPPEQWWVFRTRPDFSPCQLHGRDTVVSPGGACTTADTRWAAGQGRCAVKTALPHVFRGWVEDIGISCHSHPVGDYLFQNTLKMEGRGAGMSVAPALMCQLRVGMCAWHEVSSFSNASVAVVFVGT